MTYKIEFINNKLSFFDAAGDVPFDRDENSLVIKVLNFIGHIIMDYY